jgi:hypothetical protein
MFFQGTSKKQVLSFYSFLEKTLLNLLPFLYYRYVCKLLISSEPVSTASSSHGF